MTGKELRNRQSILEISCDEYFLAVEELLREKRTVTIPARGTSMIPFIEEGRDRVELSGTDLHGLKRGDIVLARTDKGLVLHRIVKKEEGGNFILMGDGNLHTTERCSEEDILGKAVRICREGKRRDCQGRPEIVKSWLWMRLRPVRRPLLLIWKKFGTGRSGH